MNENDQERHERGQRDPLVRPSLQGSEGQASREYEARELAELARRADPSLMTTTTERSGGRTHGVVWVRPSELMAQAGGRVAGRGIDFQAELARRARRLPTQTVASSERAITERARRLPPVTAFGRNGQSHPGTTRFGIGLR